MVHRLRELTIEGNVGPSFLTISVEGYFVVKHVSFNY